jgi:hypothetical protein
MKRRLLLLALLPVAFVALVNVTLELAEARPGNHYPVGCLRQADVNIGYYAFVVTRPTPIRVAPDDAAAPIRTLQPGNHFGVQSLPNPLRLADPGMPAAINGYVWGYSKKGGRSAWVSASALTADSGDWADGPAHHDFEAGVELPPPSRTAPRFTLGRRAAGVTTIYAHSAYLRWAPAGPARTIVLPGQQLRLLWRASGHLCVDLGGVRGWVHVDQTRAGLS